MVKCSDFFFGYNIVLGVMGLGCLGVGIWMNAERDVKAMMVVFGAHSDGNWLIASTGLLMTAGILLMGIAVLGIFGVRKENLQFIQLYLLLDVIAMLLLLIAGFLMVAFRTNMYSFVLDNMKRQVQEEYMYDNKIGKAWNRVQIRLRCCGADSAQDFRCSEWWYSLEENAGYTCPDNFYDAPIQVPDTGCVLDMNQDRDPEKVDPQDPNPKNHERCQEDAAGNMWAGSSYVQPRGCFAALHDRVFMYIYILMGIGLGIGIVQIVSVSVALMVMGSLKAKGKRPGY